jgi:hypothetical protein
MSNAVYWLVYLDTFKEARYLLQDSAEAVDWFGGRRPLHRSAEAHVERSQASDHEQAITSSPLSLNALNKQSLAKQ